MRIYIATKFENQVEFHKLRELLEKAGHTITLDWTKETLVGKAPEEVEPYLKRCAQADYRAVCDCHVLILIQHPLMVGAYVEMGMAISRFIPIIIVDPFGENKCIFRALDRVTIVKTYEEALKHV